MNLNKIKIGLIPLDSRPCNYQWVISLSNILDLDLKTIDINQVGNLHKGSNFNIIFDFFKNNFNNVDYWIISTDGCLFGGLIQARTGIINTTNRDLFFDTLVELKKQYPNVKIYFFDTVMRTSISAKTKEEAKYWALMNDYSKYFGRVHYFNQEEDKNKLEELKQIIPEYIINNYHLARNNKNYVNKKCLELLNNNIIDYEILLQEDSMPYGINHIEQDELKEYIRINNLTNIELYNGTDEGAIVLLSKIALNNSDINKNIYCYAPNTQALERVHLFEDRPFIENLTKMTKVIGINLEYEYHEQQVILAIYGENDKEDLDLAKYQIMPLDYKEAKQFSEKVNSFKHNNIILCDLKHPNGGSVDLLKMINIDNLSGYSAWNTSSNSLGTACCQVVINMLKGNTISNKDFTYERIIDDAYYQSIVRRIINQKLFEENLNPYNLGDIGDKVLNDIKSLLEGYLPTKYPKFDINLPWNRTFECDVKIKKER